MQTRELIILLLLILLAAVVIALVVRRGNAKRAEEHGAEARQMGTQAAWLESADEPVPAAAALPSTGAGSDVADESAQEMADVVEPEPMTRAERREAREAAEGVQPEPEVAAAGVAGAAWAGAGPDTDPEAERIAKAAGFRDDVTGDEALSEDIEIPANEWGGPREEALDEEPTVENPVEDDVPVDADQEPVVQPVVEPADEPAEDVAVVEEPAEDVAVVEEPSPEEPTVENPVEDDHSEEPPERQGRRISGFLELRDGGFGVGSAAPIEDGAQPLDHPVQAYRDTMTFRAPGDPGYDSAEPDVWFYDAGAAERSGFRPADA